MINPETIERKIAGLRAKAASTTFPAERDTCLRLAEKLEDQIADLVRMPTFAEAMRTGVNQDLYWETVIAAEKELQAVKFDEGWAVPGVPIALNAEALIELYILRCAP